jgi:hypothetical protein
MYGIATPPKSAQIAPVRCRWWFRKESRTSHLAIQSVALSDVDLPQLVLATIEQTQAQQQQQEQKEF